jgi:SAM-dependent methyltransferase
MLPPRGCAEVVMTLTDKDRLDLIDRYSRRFEQHGVDPRTLNVGDLEKYTQQHAIHASIGRLDGAVILDIGCGLANFYEFVKTRCVRVHYIGYDVVEPFVEANSKRFPDAKFRLTDVTRDSIIDRCDYVVMCQVFNNKYSEADNIAVVEGVMRKAFDSADKGLSIDMLSTYVSRMEDHLFYYSPEQMFAFAKTLTPYVTLLHAYLDHHFTIQLFKQRSSP